VAGGAKPPENVIKEKKTTSNVKTKKRRPKSPPD